MTNERPSPMPLWDKTPEEIKELVDSLARDIAHFTQTKFDLTSADVKPALPIISEALCGFILYAGKARALRIYEAGVACYAALDKAQAKAHS